MAYYFKLEGPALAALTAVTKEIKRIATAQLKVSEDEIVTRPLRPEDLGLSNPVWTFNISSANAWNTLISHTIPSDRFISINGILYQVSGTAVLTQLRITRAGQKKRYWQIQGAEYTENQTMFFDDPVIVEQNTPITIEGYATATSSDEKLCFLGVVAERKGILIQ
ncbi:hypothetical protein J7K27_02935 [Candidatus Bathyarchaeota archaeon]|nr:hypothetical protein [Candidatus Bathyarchaeota archaeon]